MNRKGFTLIELIVTILLLAIVASIGTYSIINIINSTKTTNYNLLLKNIKAGAETFYEECQYGETIDISTNIDITSCTEVTLGTLVKYGFITGNSKDDSKKYKIVNPNNNDDISSCSIKISYSNGNINVINNSSNGNCPQIYEVSNESDEEEPINVQPNTGLPSISIGGSIPGKSTDEPIVVDPNPSRPAVTE